MSETKNTEQDASGSSTASGYRELSAMMRQGRSFSGRERNCCFLNTGTGRFANISASSGLDIPDDGRGLAVVDWDHDGDLDLWVSNRNAPQLRFFRNDTSTRNHFLSLRLTGDGVTTSRDAIGARVEVFATRAPGSSRPTPTRMVATLRAGEGFLSQSSKWLHFGLGGAEKIERVLVHWPGGQTETFTDIESNRRYRLVQEKGKPVQIPVRTGLPAVQPARQPTPEYSAQARIPLVTLLPLPAMPYETFEGEKKALPLGNGKPVLLSLWASWCPPCLTELKEFSEQEQRFVAAGVDVIALSVDGLGDDSSSPASAARSLAKLKFPFTGGRANEPLLDMLQSMHNLLIPMQKPLPLPTSFLMDADGRLTVIYKGPVAVDDVLKDVAHSRRQQPERFASSAPLRGRIIEHEIVRRVAQREEARVYYNLGLLYSRKKNPLLAKTCYEAALRMKPDFVEALLNVGNLYLQQSDAVRAASYYRRALQVNPRFTKIHDNLGMALAIQGKVAEAQTQFEKALATDPDFLAAHYHLGVLHTKQNNLRRAVDHFEHVLRIDPTHTEARIKIDRLRVVIDQP